MDKGLQRILHFAVCLPAAPVQWIKDCFSGAQLSVSGQCGTAQTVITASGGSLCSCELLCLLPAGMSLLSPCKCSLDLQHPPLNTQHVGSSSCLSLMCSSFPATRTHGGLQGVGRDLVWKLALLRAWQGFVQAHSCTRRGQMRTPVGACLGTAVGSNPADCQPRAVMFMGTSLPALVMCYSANLPVSAG